MDSIETLEQIADKLPAAILVYESKKGSVHVIYGNAYYRSLQNTSVRNLFTLDGEGLLGLIHPDDRHSALIFFHSLFANLQPGEIVYRSQGGTGEDYRWYHVSANPMPQDDGSILAFAVFTDITSEKEAELTAEKNKRMYDLIANQSKQIIFEYDQPNKKVTFQMDSAYTRTICEAAGIPPVVLNVPSSLLGMVDEPFRKAFAALFVPFSKESPTRSLEYSTTINGQTHWWLVTSVPLFDKDGNLLTIYCCSQDITESKIQQQRYLDFFRTLDKAYPNSLGSFHLNLTKNLCLDGKSPLAFVLKQKESGTVDGYFMEFSKLIADPKTLAWFKKEFTRESLLKRFSSGETTLSFEYTIRYSDFLRYRKGLLIMHRNPRTGDVEAVTYAVDIDREKRGEEILRLMSGESSDYVGYVDCLSKTFAMHSGNWNCEGFLPGQSLPYATGVERLTAYCASKEGAEALKRESSLEKIEEKLKDNSSYSLTYDFREKDGSIKKKQVLFRYFNQQKNEILIVQTDITQAWAEEQKQFALVQSALLEAEKANSAKSDFVARISHDIRTPIGAIANLTVFAFEDIDKPEALKEDLKKIQTSNAFLLSLINDVLDISKIDSGRLELHLTPCLFVDFASNLLNMFVPLCQAKGIDFSLDDKPDCPVVYIDQVRFNQVAMNLISNAIKYTPKGGKVHVSLKAEPKGEGKCYCEFSVEDNGIGMSEKFQKIMFEPFTQEDNPLREKSSSGTGLGLSLVKKIIDLIKGNIEVKSALGKGTKITVSFIAQEATNAKEGEQTNIGFTPDKKLSGCVLVAEDNEINREICRRILETLGLKVVLVENGKKALEVFISSKPQEFNLILMDIQMPVMNGYDATRNLRALSRKDAKTIPIIAMTADAFSAAVEHSKAAGMNGYITKPLDVARLQESLAKFLSHK
ncbi:MAG: ATP-binding protein [Bacilli bacterium]|jgi:signal transduction histidine kinase/CheY-like chemotaxis protein/PAS domain-containing protein|nr:ATP-binding protein [Bacilli bacterium]